MVGHRFPGLPQMLLLDHVGAKSGVKRTMPLAYASDGEDLVLVASKGGHPKNPAWFHNLKANPDTTVQVGRREAAACTPGVAAPEEREHLWAKADAEWPDFKTYRARTDREIPLVVLEPRLACGTTLAPDTLRLGPVHLAVTDLRALDRLLQRSIGLREQGPARWAPARRTCSSSTRSPRRARPGATPGSTTSRCCTPRGSSWPARRAGCWRRSTPISGASDHGISEAIYLPDPDGNGIELAADRGRERWGDLTDPKTIGPAPLDLADLLSLTDGEELKPEADPGLVVGHLHLHVGDVDRALAFYRDLVGFEVMTQFPSAAFIAAGGYHHHLGLNTWRGEGAPPAPPDAVGLRRWTVVLDGPQSLAELRERLEAGGVEVVDADGGLLAADPWGNRRAVRKPRFLRGERKRGHLGVSRRRGSCLSR